MRLDSESLVPGSGDLFVEVTDSASISWRRGSAVVMRGIRAGAGARASSRSGTTVARAIDDPSPKRTRELLLSLGIDGQLDSGPEPRADTTECERCRTIWLGAREIAPAGATIEEEIAASVEYLESLAQGVMTEIAARTVEADVHLYCQAIHLHGARGAIDDHRGGVRAEIRVAVEGERHLARRIADRDLAQLASRLPPRTLGTEIGTAALLRRAARARPDGIFPTVFEPRGCGALLHEIGHLFEEDHAKHAGGFVRGRRIAPENVTIVDDPSACAGRGQYRYDDEGAPAAATILVDRGNCTDTLRIARRGAASDGEGGNGHARRASYRDLPLARMACTYLATGQEDPDEIVRDTARGLFIRSLRTGDVDPASGAITLIVEEGYLIEGGRITSALDECIIVASASELLGSIDAVGTDLQFDHGAGNCVKLDQPVPVIVGMPTIRTRVVRVFSP